MKTQTINNPRTPTLLESLFPIFTMVVLLGGGYAAFDLPPEPLRYPRRWFWADQL